MVKGMKLTEIGWIPEDWEVKAIGDITEKLAGGGTPSRSIKEYWNGNIPWMTVKDFASFNGHSTQEYITELGLKSSATRIVKASNLIIATRIALGKIVKYKVDVTINQDLKTITLSSEVNKDYFSYFYQSIENKIIEKGSGSTVLGLSIQDLYSFQIPLPPLLEQEAITGVLSDADAWIESLEQLIAKKRLIKQGAMQELLTPKEGWEVKTILEIADGKRDLFNDGDWIESEHIFDEGIRLVQTGNIGIGKFVNKANRKYINELSFNKLKCKELREGDLLICRLAEPAGRACLFPKTDDYKSVTSVDVTIYRPDVQKYDRRFLLFSLSTDQWFTDVIEQVGGTTHKRISRGNLGRINISVPQLTEQTRIATILSDMDAELEALEQQLHKARQIKQGMMQELLTGKIRLEL